MKAALDFLASKLTPIAVLLILAYIGYSELIRPSRLAEKLNQALSENKALQTDMRKLEKQLGDQQADLNTALGQLNRVDAGLLDLMDSVSVINGRYKAIKAELDKQSAVYLDRYNQKKTRIQDIQKSLR